METYESLKSRFEVVFEVRVMNLKVKIEVNDDEFPQEWPRFPEHLILMWAGVREEILQRLIGYVLLIPPILPAVMAISELRKKH